MALPPIIHVNNKTKFKFTALFIRERPLFYLSTSDVKSPAGAAAGRRRLDLVSEQSHQQQHCLSRAQVSIMTRGRRSLGRKAVSVAVHSTLGHALTTIWNLVADMAFCCQFGIIYLAILVKYSGFTQNQISVLSNFVWQKF